MTNNMTLKLKLQTYPDWDRHEQIKRNLSALERLEKRRKATLKISDLEAQEREIFFEEFKKRVDQYRPREAKLYNPE